MILRREKGVAGRRGARGRSLATGLGLVMLAAPLAEGAEPVKIVYAHTGENPGLQRMVELFNAEHPDIKVEFQPIGNYFDSLAVQLAAGTGPDVFYMHPHNIRQFARSGLLADLTPYVNRDSARLNLKEYFPLALEQSRVDGRYYSWPYGLVEAGRILYNANLFENAGMLPPQPTWTWLDYQAVARKLTLDQNGDGTPDQWGSSRLGFREIVQYNLAGGGQFYSDDFRSFLPVKQPALDAFAFAAGLIQSGATAVTVGSRQWQEGKLAMLLTHLPGALNSAWDVRQRFNAASTVQPMHPNGNRRILVHSNMFAVNVNSKHKDAAWEFIRWAVEPGGYARAGREAWGVAQLLPPRRDVALTPYFLEVDPARGPKNVNPALSIDIVSKWGVPELVPQQHARVLALFSEHWSRVERGELSPVAFYDTLIPLVDALLKENQ